MVYKVIVIMKVSDTEKIKAIEMEREADMFARCLLMPRNLVEEEVKSVKHLDFDEAIGILAKKFLVEKAMVICRLGELNMLEYGMAPMIN